MSGNYIFPFPLPLALSVMSGSLFFLQHWDLLFILIVLLDGPECENSTIILIILSKKLKLNLYI